MGAADGGPFPGTLGGVVAGWITQNLVHGPGDVYGQRITLTPEERRFLDAAYRLDPQTGRRIVQRATYSRRKGHRKSELLAWVTIFEALGPARAVLHRGQPVAVRVTDPWCICAATTQDQADETVYGAIQAILRASPVADQVDVGQEVTNLVGRSGKITAPAMNPTALDGGKPTFEAQEEALALDTPLPTPSGWTTMGEVRAGDWLVGADGRPVRVVKATDVQHGRQCYRLTFQDGTSIVASGGHLWMTRVARSSALPQVRTTAEMVADGRAMRVPRVSAVELPEAHLPVDPYVLGAWLGDGDTARAYLTVGAEDADAMLSILAARGQFAQIVDKTASGCLRVSLRNDPATCPHGHPGPWRDVPRYGARGTIGRRCIPCTNGGRSESPRRSLQARLRTLGVLGDKHVPAQYLRASRSQRLALLQGLMDTDGHATPDGGAVFATTLESLARAVGELVRSLGWQAGVRVSHYRRQPQHRPLWRVTFRPSGSGVPFLLPRKAARARTEAVRLPWHLVASIEPVESVPVRCVAVDSADHLFAAGEGWQVTHNTHLWYSARLRECDQVMTRNLRKRPLSQPWLMAVTTGHKPGQNSVGERHHAHGLRVMADPYLDPTTVYDHLEAPAELDLSVDGELRRAIAAAAGDATWFDMDYLVGQYHDPDADEATFRRYWLNQSVAGADQFATPSEWSQLSVPGEKLQPGDTVVLGFDGSAYDDSTALVAVRLHDGFTQLLACWSKPEGSAGEGWSVPRGQVNRLVAHAMDRYQVMRLEADPPYWRDEIAQWRATYGSVVREFHTNRPTSMGPAIERAQSAIRAQAFRHDGSETLARHVTVARLVDDRGYPRLAKPRDGSKIDAGVAWTIAYDARGRVLGDSGVPESEQPAEVFGFAAWS